MAGGVDAPLELHTRTCGDTSIGAGLQARRFNFERGGGNVAAQHGSWLAEPGCDFRSFPLPRHAAIDRCRCAETRPVEAEIDVVDDKTVGRTAHFHAGCAVHDADCAQPRFIGTGGLWRRGQRVAGARNRTLPTDRRVMMIIGDVGRNQLHRGKLHASCQQRQDAQIAFQHIGIDDQRAVLVGDDDVFELDARAGQHGESGFAFRRGAQAGRVHHLFGKLAAQRVARESPWCSRSTEDCDGEGQRQPFQLGGHACLRG